MKPYYQDKYVFDRECRVSSVVLSLPRQAVDFMVKTHYLHKWPGVVVAVLGMKCFGELCGTVIFALPPRETNKRYGGYTWELARLWVDDSIPKNAETWLISQSVKWVRVNHPEVEYLVSYADPSVGHNGTIYQAANWTNDGHTDEGRRTPRFDYRCVDTGKHYSRHGHIPHGVEVERVPRTSKARYVLPLKKGQTQRLRQAANRCMQEVMELGV